MLKKSLFLLLLQIQLFSTEIVYKNIKEYEITQDKLNYIIEAETKKIDFDKLKKIKIFNIKNRLAQASFYLNGKIIKEKTEILFEKAHFYQGNFYMSNIKSSYKNYY